MDPLDIAATPAELSIAILGFTGVVVVLGSRSSFGGLGWSFRFWSLTISGAGAFVGSLIPLVLSAGMVNPWPWSSLVLIVLLLYMLTTGVAKLARGDIKPLRTPISQE